MSLTMAHRLAFALRCAIPNASQPSSRRMAMRMRRASATAGTRSEHTGRDPPSEANRAALRAFLLPETTVWQYTHGVADASSVSPDGYSLDNYYLARPGADEVQLDLFG